MSLDKAATPRGGTTPSREKDKPSTRETKSDGNLRNNQRRKKKKPDKTQEDATIAVGIEDDTAIAPSGRKVQSRPKKPAATIRGSVILPVVTTAIKAGKNALTPEIEKQLDEFVKMVMSKGVDGLRKEFAELKIFTPPDFKYTVFSANVPKNRYKDVVCLDTSRVVLNLSVPPEGDYIHANKVQLDGLSRTYIATQGPLENTTGDFWRMVFQENATSVVMLTKLVEDTKIKCYKYYPETGSYKNYGPMFVNNKKSEINEDKQLMHVMEVLPDGCSNSNIVRLIQMNDWPDRGVPDKAMGVLRLIRAIPPGLCVIHCSAGIGRTGTVILIDAIMGKILKGQPVDVKALFKQLRMQRASAVQTEAQYVFIHSCVMEYIRVKIPQRYRAVVAQFAEQVKKANMT